MFGNKNKSFQQISKKNPDQPGPFTAATINELKNVLNKSDCIGQRPLDKCSFFPSGDAEIFFL